MSHRFRLHQYIFLCPRWQFPPSSNALFQYSSCIEADFDLTFTSVLVRRVLPSHPCVHCMDVHRSVPTLPSLSVVSGMFMACSWRVHGVFMACSWRFGSPKARTLRTWHPPRKQDEAPVSEFSSRNSRRGNENDTLALRFGSP